MHKLGLQNCNRGSICLKGYGIFSFIFIILQGFQGLNLKYKKANVNGLGWVCDFGWTR
jgi:hypothetical protein